MKSTTELVTRLARQWRNPDLRETRLLHSPAAWPIRLPIGRPSGYRLEHEFDAVRAIVHEWQEVSVGTVEWEERSFRATREAVSIPRYWVLDRPSDWIKATRDRNIQAEYNDLSRLISSVDARFHSLFVRSFSLWRDRGVEETITVASVATGLKPGCAEGKPLRAMATGRTDTKFFERHRALLVRLLDILYGGQVSDLGLETFLDALEEGEHWLLVADLDGGLLPFPRLRLQSKDLKCRPLPGRNLLIVENERCLYQLPECAGTVAVLGCGRNLSWLEESWLREKRVGYWGDIDTWGLAMLAEARRHCPNLIPLLMELAVFETYAETLAVPEPVSVSGIPVAGLDAFEIALFEKLQESENGRLEQEFIPLELVHEVVLKWAIIEPGAGEKIGGECYP